MRRLWDGDDEAMYQEIVNNIRRTFGVDGHAVARGEIDLYGNKLSREDRKKKEL